MGKSPYEFGKFMMPPDFDDSRIALGLEDIPSTDVILAPKLLQHKTTEVNAIENEP